MTLSKKDTAELDRLTEQVKRWDHRSMMSRGYGHRMAVELMKAFPNDTMSWSEAIAQMCMTLDERNGCQKLLIEWFHDHFAAFVVERSLHEIHTVLSMLKSLRYTATDWLEESDDYSSWFECDGAFIMEDQNTRIAVVIEDKSTPSFKSYHLHARYLHYKYDHDSKRKYWGYPTLATMRKKKWKMKYGDCRDAGYIVTYEDVLNRKTADRAVFYWSKIEHFLFRINTLHAVLDSVQTGRLGQLHSEKLR